MISKYDLLNDQIDRMQAERGLSLVGDVDLDDPNEYIRMLQMAAQLKSSRPGDAEPDPGFLADLRARVLAACEQGTLPPAGPRISRL